MVACLYSLQKLKIPFLFSFFCWSVLAFSQDAGEKGLLIAKAVHEKASSYHDQVVNVKMILKNKDGDEATRDLVVKTLEVENDGAKSLVIFQGPQDVKGTALLSFSHKTENDDQWLYLPALKRVKRISSSRQDGPFMGSEFAYEDMSSQEIEKYTYKFIKSDIYEGKKVDIIERYPTNKYSGYTRQVVTVDTEKKIIWKIEFYDRKKALLKTLIAKNYKLYKNRHERPDTLHMTNHQTGKETILEWSDYRFKTGLTERDFNKSTLGRIR